MPALRCLSCPSYLAKAETILSGSRLTKLIHFRLGFQADMLSHDLLRMSPLFHVYA